MATSSTGATENADDGDCIYFTCWYNQETQLERSTEDRQLPPCTVSVNKRTNSISVEVETADEELSPIEISAADTRYVKPIQENEVLLSWWEHGKGEFTDVKFAWLTFKETEHAAVTTMIHLIQRIQSKTRPNLPSILTFEGCGNIMASVTLLSDKDKSQFENYFFIVDKELLVIFKSSLEKQSAAMHFYKEPGPHAIEQVLSRKDIAECEIKTPYCSFVFKLESVGANILLESIRKCRPLPRKIFTDEKALIDHKMKPREDPHAEALLAQIDWQASGPDSQDLADPFDWIINTLNVGYDAVSSEDQLAIMWAATEADISEVIANGFVPGSSIASSGMDPNSHEHFAKCIDEMQDALFEGSYPKAVSLLRGTKQLFSECRYPAVKSFFKKNLSDVEILKKIYFRDRQ